MGRVPYGRSNTYSVQSTVRRLTVRTVHVLIVNICGCESMVVGEIFTENCGSTISLSVNTSRCVYAGGGWMDEIPSAHIGVQRQI